MSRKSWKLLGITAVAVAAVGTGLAFNLSSQATTAEAASVAIPRPGTICIKPASMTHIFAPRGTSTGPVAATNGSITAQVGQPISTTDGRSGFQFGVTNFISNGFVQGLGNVSIKLDTSRKPAVSTFISNSPSSAGALTAADSNTQRINFFITVGIDGQQYRSQGQVTLLGTAVDSFPPPPGTVYELASPVNLLDSAGNLAFVLPAGHAARISG